jgi:predicted Holliday junction resolvase-like endonuclease
MDAIMKILLIWVVWLALVLWWLTPEMNAVKDKINAHNAQIEKALNE